MSDPLAFDDLIADRVAAVREEKLRVIASTHFPNRKKRKPRFCMATQVRLCPRQMAKKYKTS